MLDNFVASAGGFEELAYFQDEDEMDGREITKLAEPFISLSSLPVWSVYFGINLYLL